MAYKFLKYSFLLILLIAGCKHGGGGSSGNSGSSSNSSSSSSSGSPGDSSSSSSSSSGGQEPVFYPFEPDYTTPGGIDIDLNGHDPEPIEGSIAPEFIEGLDVWYAETQQCVADWFAILYPGMNYEFYDPPPIVVAIDPESICGNFDEFINGIYCASFAIPVMVIRGGITYRSPGVWKHETIHHLLYMNDIDRETNINHKPDEIWQNCVH